jgi:hypothetical protein
VTRPGLTAGALGPSIVSLNKNIEDSGVKSLGVAEYAVDEGDSRGVAL